jgi:hypothetical protein
MPAPVSFKEAALQILRKAERPLTAKEIVDKAIESGTLQTEGATPDATMGAVLYVDIRHPNSKFKKIGKGKFALKDSNESATSADVIIERQNQLVRTALRQKIEEMDASQFEYLVGDLLAELGYEKVQVIGKSGDKGIDIRAELTMGGITSVKTVVQVKKWKQGNNVSGSVIAQLRGSAEVDQRGLVITTSEFTKDGIAEASAQNKMPVALINGERLLDLMLRHAVGVKKEMMPVYSLDAEYFDNVDTDAEPSTASEKNSALWPLPGGIFSYVESLFAALDAVATNNFTKRDFVRWFMKTFEQVKSEKTANGYANVPRSIGLIRLENSRVRLTPDGASVQRSRDRSVLFEIFAKNILGIEEIIEFLKNADGPQTEADVFNLLKENLGVEWTTFAQVNFRLLWLVNLGKVTRKDGGYVLAAGSSI